MYLVCQSISYLRDNRRMHNAIYYPTYVFSLDLNIPLVKLADLDAIFEIMAHRYSHGMSDVQFPSLNDFRFEKVMAD